MKSKIIKLKKDIDSHLLYLQLKYPMAKLLSKDIDSLLQMNTDDESIKHWYSSHKNFLNDIEKEINKLDDEVYIYEKLSEFKKQVDKYYKDLKDKYSGGFLCLYMFVEFLLDKELSSKQLKDTYTNIYISMQIIQEEVQRIENSKEGLNLSRGL